MNELADVLGLERTSLSRSAGVLERNDWIREAPSADARERPLRLTVEGRRKIEAAFPAWKAAQERVEREIDDRERKRRAKAPQKPSKESTS